MHRLRPSSGFTLIELLLVLVLIAIVGLLVAPRVVGGASRGAVEGQARAVVALTRKAHALSASEGRTYLLVVDPVERHVRLARQRDPLAEPQDEEEPELDVPARGAGWAERFEFHAEVQLVSVELGDPLAPILPSLEEPLRVAFHPSGEADAARLVFALADGSDALRITIDPFLGLARIGDEELVP